MRPPALHLTPLPCSADETSFEVGVKVQIHSQDEPPFIDQLGFGVAPGFQTFVSCQQQRVSGHGARGWAHTPEGSGWAPGGIGTDPRGLGMVTQRDQNGPSKGWDGLVLPQTSPWAPQPSPRGHTLPSQAMGPVPLPWPGAAQGVGRPHSRCRQPHAGRAPAATPGSCRTAAGGWRLPAPAARHLNLGASGGCHHVCRHMGGRSTAAAGMWPRHPRVGGAGSSPGMIPAPGGGWGSLLTPAPGTSCSCTLPRRAPCQTLLWHPVQVTTAATAVPPERRGQGGTGALAGQGPQHWL